MRENEYLFITATRHGSSIGMALAAMEALNNLNLFGEEVCDMGLEFEM